MFWSPAVRQHVSDSRRNACVACLRLSVARELRINTPGEGEYSSEAKPAPVGGLSTKTHTRKSYESLCHRAASWRAARVGGMRWPGWPGPQTCWRWYADCAAQWFAIAHCSNGTASCRISIGSNVLMSKEVKRAAHACKPVSPRLHGLAASHPQLQQNVSCFKRIC